MSANNVILVKEFKKKGKESFLVSMRDAEMGVIINRPVRTSSLRKAIEEANVMLMNNEVEYGLRIELKKV